MTPSTETRNASSERNRNRPQSQWQLGSIHRVDRYHDPRKWQERSRRHQPYRTIELLVANDGRTACPVKAVSHRRWGPKASLDRACRPAILGHRVPTAGRRTSRTAVAENAENPSLNSTVDCLKIVDTFRFLSFVRFVSR